MNSDNEIAKLKKAVVSCEEDEMISAALSALEKNIEPGEISKAISEGIMLVGDEYGKGQMFLPDLILAGNGAMKAMAVVNEAILKKGLKKIDNPTKVLIGTVAGDVHNIGKDTVGAMLMAAGFEVYDLGVNVPADKFVDMAESYKVNIVAMSALMTTTMVEQEKIINVFKDKGKREKYKIIVGGAPTTIDWANKIGADGWGENAAEAVRAVKKLIG